MKKSTKKTTKKTVKKTGKKVTPKKPKVIIRTYSAGVHYGTLESRKGKEVVLSNTRRIWCWEGAATLSEIALRGVNRPEGCKFSVYLPKIILTEAIEIIPCLSEGIKSIESVPEWVAPSLTRDDSDTDLGSNNE